MLPLGPKIAEGRDSEIYEHGPGLVLRRSRDGRSLVLEAEVMTYVRERGFPAPSVEDAGEGFLVMERLDGPTMLDDLAARPWTMRRSGRVLADLHAKLHELEAPPGVPAIEPAGDRLLHRDLHPLNVLMTTSGPVVIDWANAARGDPSYDVADTWVLLSTADVPGGRLQRLLAAAGRSIFLRQFLAPFDPEPVRSAVAFVAANRLGDRNMSERERTRIRRMAEQVESSMARDVR